MSGVLLTLVALPVLWRLGVRWVVPGEGSVGAALAGYAVTALALDQATGWIGGRTADPVLLAGAVFLEEGGEALAAVLLLAAVARRVPRR